MIRGRPPVALEIRFWQQVAKRTDDQCWLWIGAKDKDGYGKIKTRDRKTIRPHRLSWEIHRGPVPEGMQVCHDCPGKDNPSCVNPSHLWLGTSKDNCLDSFRKGRTPTQGEQCKQTKLSAFTVEFIRVLYDSGEYSQGELAKIFNLNFSHIHKIVLRKIWKHLG